MGDEEELERALGGAQAAVVEGGDDGLAGAGGGDHEVAGVAAAALGVEPVEDLLLEGVRADVDVEGEGLGAGALLQAEGLIDAVGVGGRVVGLELALLPVLLEGGLELAQDLGGLDVGEADVPLEAVGNGRGGQVGGADQGGGVARVAVEEPGLGVEAGAAGVVGDPDPGAGGGESSRIVSIEHAGLR